MKPLTRDEVLTELRLMKNDFTQKYGVIRIGVFGSCARNEANESSDVDIVVELRDPDLFHLVHIKDTLTRRLGRPVDLVTLRASMNSYLKAKIHDEAVYA